MSTKNKSNKTKTVKSKSLDKKNESNSNPNVNEYLHLPKNVNEYKQIIDTFLCRDSDVEWIFDLRGYQKNHKFVNLKNTSMNQPSFYHDDFMKYKKKVDKEKKEKENNLLHMKGNISPVEHLLTKRLNLPANPSQFNFDGTLRKFESFEKVTGPPSLWKSLNLNPKKTLLDTFLPPLTKNSQRNLSNINKYVSRPYEIVREVKIFFIIF